MRLPVFRWAPRLALLSFLLLVSGCADMLPFAGFGGSLALGPFRHYVQNLPVQRVVKQVECELREFLTEFEKLQLKKIGEGKRPSNLYLDPAQAASIVLNLQTEEAGGVTYTGVDLSKIGLTTLGALVSASNKIPNLQARAQIKGTVSAQLDLAIPQTIKDFPLESNEDQKKLARQLANLKADLADIKFRLGVPGLKPSESSSHNKKADKPAFVRGLMHAPPCPEGLESILRYSDFLYLKQWLLGFFDGYANDPDITESCLTKLTLKTSFQLLVDFSGGANLAAVPIIILPISGINLSYSPAFTHSIQITFGLAKNNNEAICKTSPQPNNTVTR